MYAGMENQYPLFILFYVILLIMFYQGYNIGELVLDPSCIICIFLTNV